MAAIQAGCHHGCAHQKAPKRRQRHGGNGHHQQKGGGSQSVVGDRAGESGTYRDHRGGNRRNRRQRTVVRVGGTQARHSEGGRRHYQEPQRGFARHHPGKGPGRGQPFHRRDRSYSSIAY